MITMEHKVEHIRAADVASAKGPEGEAVMIALDAYLEPFAKPVVVDGKQLCPNCGEPIDAFKQALGLGVAWEWGLTHGEARCSGCGWPARGMHYVKDENGETLITMRNVFLAYHPDTVIRRGDGA